jgi:hypothetical protein
VLRHARPDVIPFALGASAGQNDVGVGVLKDLQHPPARVLERQQQVWRVPALAQSTATVELGTVGDAHEVAVPRGLEVRAPEPDFESG